MCYLETIIVLVILVFNFIYQRSHCSLTLMRSQLRDSYCNSSIWGWHNSYQSGAIDITNKLVLRNRKKILRCAGGTTIDGLKTLSCGTPDAMLTSLLKQLSTITFCDKFDTSCVDNTDPHRTELIKNSLKLDPIKGALKSICMIQASGSLSNMLCSVWATHKSASQVPRPFR